MVFMNYEEYQKFLIEKLYKGEERITITKKMSSFLRKEREKTMFTMREIGKMIGVSAASMENYECMLKKTMPKSSFEKLQDLYKAFRDGNLKPKFILNTKSISKEISRKRKKLNYFIREFADKLNSKESIIANIELGRKKLIPHSLLEKIEILYREELNNTRYKTNNEILGIYLRKARVKNKLLISQVAEKINVSHTLIGSYETGKIKNINKDIIEKLANLYGVNIPKITVKNIENLYEPIKGEKLNPNFILNTKDIRKKLTDNREKSCIVDVEKMLNIPQHTIANIESGEIKYIPYKLFKNIETLYQSKIDKLKVIANNKLLGIKLKEARKANNLSLRQVAEKLNISDSVICNYENGKKFTMQEDIIKKLKKFYKIK
jgi:transcriptional regulator with XRE-family HTH domain